MKIRVGFGYDVHCLENDCKLNLGGIDIPHYKGTLGHSDGDVVIHALIDALLGAANLRDIGFHFPDSDMKYKGIDSKLLLKEVKSLLDKKEFSIGNIDMTVCLQTPRLKEHIELMKKTISLVLDIDVEDISIKATTTEKMGFIGKEKGVSCYAVVLLQKE